MRTEQISNQEWFSANSEHFAVVNSSLGEISTGNTAFTTLIDEGMVTTPELKQIVRDDIAQEQTEVLKRLNDIPFEEAFARWSSTEEELAQIAVQKIITEPDKRLRQEQEAILSHRPNLAQKIAEVVDKLEKSRHEMTIGELVAKEHVLRQESDTFEKLFQAWPIPKAAVSEESLELIVDKFPDEPLPVDFDVFERARKRFFDKKMTGASELLATLLATEPGKIFTREEIAEFMYGGDARTPFQRVTCVASLISGHETGKVKIIAPTLAAEGLVLQRGARQIKDASGKIIASRIPIFRAVPAGNESDEEVVIRGDDGTTQSNRAWHDRRSKIRTQNAAKTGNDSKDILMPASAKEKQLVIDLSRDFRAFLTANGYLQRKSLGLLEILNHMDEMQYPSIGSLKQSVAWKLIVGANAETAMLDDGIRIEYAALVSVYDGYRQYLQKPANVKRALSFVEQLVTTWREAARESQSIA